jgi:signal transduction histidine kinase
LNLVENKHQVEASERAKTDFLSNVSHELRTPMNAVVGITYLLQMTGLSAKQSEYVERLETSANDMMTLISSVLSFLESETPLLDLPNKPFSLRTTVQESINSLTSKAANNSVTLSVDIAPELPDNMSGLPDKIQLILYHLLSNAIKFAPSGKVSVAIKPGLSDETSVQLHCSVTDTGIGINPNTQSIICEPFIQADGSLTRKFGGLGIGLSIATRMVQLMGGTLNVESNPGGGSIFSFTVTCAIAPDTLR